MPDNVMTLLIIWGSIMLSDLVHTWITTHNQLDKEHLGYCPHAAKRIRINSLYVCASAITVLIALREADTISLEQYRHCIGLLTAAVVGMAILWVSIAVDMLDTKQRSVAPVPEPQKVAEAPEVEEKGEPVRVVALKMEPPTKDERFLDPDFFEWTEMGKTVTIEKALSTQKRPRLTVDDFKDHV